MNENFWSGLYKHISAVGVNVKHGKEMSIFCPHVLFHGASLHNKRRWKWLDISEFT